VVSVKPQPHFPQGKNLRYPLGRRLGGPQSQPVWTQRLEEKSSYLFRGSNLDHLVIQSIDTVLTELPGSFHDYKVWLFEVFLQVPFHYILYWNHSQLTRNSKHYAANQHTGSFFFSMQSVLRLPVA
jgi:hypothetical protein